MILYTNTLKYFMYVLVVFFNEIGKDIVLIS